MNFQIKLKFRAGEQQAALSILANSKNIHLIASSDHVNASLLWRTVRPFYPFYYLQNHFKPVCDKFSWLYVAISTGKCYGTELLVSDSRALGLNSKSHGRNHTHEAIVIFEMS
jgi:hypothetical protein